MVCRLLNFLYPLSVCGRKFLEYLIHKVFLSVNAADFCLVLAYNLLRKQCLEPAELNVHAETHECILGEVGAQWVASSRISSINWTDGRKRTYFCDQLCFCILAEERL